MGFRTRLRIAVRTVVAAGCLATFLAATGCGVHGNWPDTARGPVPVLDHSDLATAAAELPGGPERGFAFAVYGDQRALADGEWQAMVAEIGRLQREDPRLLAIIDTGDIVDDGRFTDQFVFLRNLLEPVRDLPYLVAVGNHEVHNNGSPRVRNDVARFLSRLDSRLDADRLYYRQDVGPVSFLFLDTNDLVYGPDGSRNRAVTPESGSRSAAQLAWLSRQLAGDGAEGPLRTTVVVGMHHPFLQSSAKHHGAAASLWNLTWRGRRLVDLLLDGSVDVVLTGHTHTYERFRLRRVADGRELELVNLSGRPRPSFLFFGAGARRAQDIAGREAAWLAEHGWTGLDGYEIDQVDAMLDEQTNQFGWFEVGGAGSLSLVLHRQSSKHPERFRVETSVDLVAGAGKQHRMRLREDHAADGAPRLR